jgi:uncharacterized protein YndB with AHSA1/START domain
MSRATATASVEVGKPPAEVFAYLCQVSRHGEWSPRAYRVEGIEAGVPLQQGTRYTSFGWVPRDPDHRNDVEVSEVTAPTRLVLTATDGGEQFISTFTVTPSGTGCRVQRVLDMPRPGGLIGLVFPLILAALVKPDVAKGLGRLKTNLEHTTHQPG